MSTILDALRKSEQERKLNKLPTLNDMAAPKEPSRWPVYLGLALVVLAISLVVLAYVIWNAKDESAQAVKGQINTDIAESSDASLSQAQEEPINGSFEGEQNPVLVNVVSYSDDPSLRFAMVNGKMVREGEFLRPGLKVESIQADAVVFNQRGRKITRSP